MHPALTPVLGIVDKVLTGLGLDPEAKRQAQAQAFELLTAGDFAQRSAQALALAQIDTNKAEAQAGGWWRAGGRPFVIWTCGSALALQFVVGPMIEWGAIIAGHPLPPLPKLDGVLWELLAGLLGLGALRTVEKVKGAA